MQRQSQIQFEEIIKADGLDTIWKISKLIKADHIPDADTVKLAKTVLDATTEFEKKERMAIYSMLLIAQDPKEGFKQFVKNFSGFRENFTMGQAQDEISLLRGACYDGFGIRLIVPDAKPDTYILLTSNTAQNPLRVFFTEQGLQVADEKGVAWDADSYKIYNSFDMFCFDLNSNEQAFELYRDKHLVRNFYPDLESAQGIAAAKEAILQKGGYLLSYNDIRKDDDIRYRCYTLVEDKVASHKFKINMNGGFYSNESGVHSDLTSLLKSFKINLLQEQKSEAPSKDNQLRQYKQQIERTIQKQYEEEMLGEAISYAQAKFKLLKKTSGGYIIRKAENMPGRFKVTLLVPPLIVDHLLSDKNKSMRDVKSEIDALRVALQEKVKQKTKPSQEQKQEIKSESTTDVAKKEFTTDIAKEEFQKFVKASFQAFLVKEQGNIFKEDKEKMFQTLSDNNSNHRRELDSISKDFCEFIKPDIESFLDRIKRSFGEDQVVWKKIKNYFESEQYYEVYAYERLECLVSMDFRSMLLPMIKEAADKYYKKPSLTGRASSFISGLFSSAPTSAQQPKGPEKKMP